jgi:hypothetical protein
LVGGGGEVQAQASTSEGAIEQAELLELAETCEAVAIKVEDQMTAG